MARSTGPILAAGIVTWSNRTLFEEGAKFELDESVRIAVGTGVAAMMLAALGRLSPELASGLAWAALATVMLVPIGGTRNSPATNALRFVGL